MMKINPWLSIPVVNGKLRIFAPFSHFKLFPIAPEFLYFMYFTILSNFTLYT